MEHIHTFDSRRVAVLPLQKVSHFHFNITKEFHYVILKRTDSEPEPAQNHAANNSAVSWQCTQPKEVIHHLPIISNSPPSPPGAWLNLLMWAAINTRWAPQPYGHKQTFSEQTTGKPWWQYCAHHPIKRSPIPSQTVLFVSKTLREQS